MIKRFLNIKKIDKINASTNIENAAMSEVAANNDLEINADEARDIDVSINIKKTKIASNAALIAFVVIAAISSILYVALRQYIANATTDNTEVIDPSQQPVE